jgi:hypothetical protein
MECGSNYSRSMASYALLLAYSGFSFDMTRQAIGFEPVRDGKYFWSLDKAWGVFEQTEKLRTLEVLYGTQELRRLTLQSGTIHRVSLDGKALDFTNEGQTLVFPEPLRLGAGQRLTAE